MDLLEFTLLPEENLLIHGDGEGIYADKTYGLDLKNRCVAREVQGEEALKQCIFKILATEKGAFPIYSASYGVALDDLKYLAAPVVESELKRRISEALLVDERIEEVKDFTFTRRGGRLDMTFTVCQEDTAVKMEWSVEGL